MMSYLVYLFFIGLLNTGWWSVDGKKQFETIKTDKVYYKNNEKTFNMTAQAQSEGVILFTLSTHLKNTGWIGLGIGSSRMAGSFMVVCHGSADGRLVRLKSYQGLAPHAVQPLDVAEKGVVFDLDESASRISGDTIKCQFTATLSLPLSKDFSIHDAIWALGGPSIPPEGPKALVGIHSFRGSFETSAVSNSLPILKEWKNDQFQVQVRHSAIKKKHFDITLSSQTKSASFISWIMKNEQNQVIDYTVCQWKKNSWELVYKRMTNASSIQADQIIKINETPSHTCRFGRPMDVTPHKIDWIIGYKPLARVNLQNMESLAEMSGTLDEKEVKMLFEMEMASTAPGSSDNRKNAGHSWAPPSFSTLILCLFMGRMLK